MTAPIAPGIVTSLVPFLVQLGSDAPGGQPCQRVAPAQIGQRGGVLILGGQRVWLGAYDQAPAPTMPKARHLILSTAQTVPSGTDTTISAGWTSGAKDDPTIPFTNGMFVVPAAGVYTLSIGAMWAANATGSRWVQFRQNGALGPTLRSAPAASGVTTQTYSLSVNAAAGDALGFTYHQTSGAGLNCGGHATQTWLQCARIS